MSLKSGRIPETAFLVRSLAGSARTHDRSDEILTKIMRLKQGFLEGGVERSVLQ